MITKEELAGSWNDIKGRVKQEWANITDDDLRSIEGSVDRLVGLIQKKTGQARNEIEKTLRSLSDKSSGMFSSASQAVQDTRQAVQEYSSQAGEMAREQFQRAQEMVRHHPRESVFVSFATGLVLGVAVGLMIRSK